MPKRKRDNEFDKISRKLRKLERKLRRARQRDDDCENIEPSAHNITAAKNDEDDDPTIEPSIGSKLSHSVDSVFNMIEPEERQGTPGQSELLVQSEFPVQTEFPVQSEFPVQIDLSAQSELPVQSELQVHKTLLQPTSTPDVCSDIASGAVISVDDDLEELLGEDPSECTEYGKDIHIGLSKRLEHIIVNGLDNDVRKELNKKYLCPANCTRIIPPLLNPEIKAALPELSVKRDKGMEARQKQVGAAISCLSEIVSTQLQEQNKNPTLLKQLMDATKIICDIFHSDSAKRRYFALSSLKKDVNEHLQLTKVDRYLFGESLAETLKTAKAVTKSGDEIKVNYNVNNKKPQTQTPISRGLNWKAPPPARRLPGPQRSHRPYQPPGQKMMRPPPPPTRRPQPQHDSSSRTSQYQQRPSRRY